MSEFFYQSGWGAFTMILLMQIPFAIVFLWVVYRKGFAAPQPSTASAKQFSRTEIAWLGLAGGVFVLVNVLSISYFPSVSTAHAAASGVEIQDVDVVARSWSYEISEREYEVGKPVRFNVRSADTMHSFSVYHPDGRVLFTMQLVPGVDRPTSMIYTFKDPGNYTVRCLEYCGIAHHGMRDQLTVIDSRSS